MTGHGSLIEDINIKLVQINEISVMGTSKAAVHGESAEHKILDNCPFDHKAIYILIYVILQLLAIDLAVRNLIPHTRPDKKTTLKLILLT